MQDFFRDYELVRSYFEEELSRKIFDYKLNFYVKNYRPEFLDMMYEFYDNSKITGFTDYYSRRSGKEIIYFGTGKLIDENLRALNHAGYQVSYIVISESEMSSRDYEGIPIITLSECVLEHFDSVVIISDIENGNDYYNQLISFGFMRENIYKEEDKLRTEFGDIYFDFPGLVECADPEGEVFVDGGAFDGISTRGFANWCKANGLPIEKVYLFEPMKEGMEVSKARLADLPVEYCQCGLGEENGELRFMLKGNNLRGSKVSEEGELVIPIKTIDNVTKGQKVTFIKMDVEGSEAEALKGACETIQKYKPKLAISMYHLRRDILVLPKLIKELNPEYKLYLRHYSNYKYDFVLYAI